MQDITKLIKYDLALLPYGMDVDMLLHVAETTRYLFYNSDNVKGNWEAPTTIDPDNLDKIVIDVSGVGGEKIYNKIVNKIKGNG